MVGLFHGKSHLEMDDDWGYPYFRKPPKWTASTIEANFSDNRFADLREMDDRISRISRISVSGKQKGKQQIEDVDPRRMVYVGL